MRQRNIKNQDEIIKESDKHIENIQDIINEASLAKYDEIHLEVGIGKGAFISEKARLSPNKLFVGIDLNKGVISLACKKIKRFEESRGVKLDNLKVKPFNALELENMVKPNTVDVVYLNFSDPWPKKRHEKRRLTSDDFIKVYKNILKVDGRIEIKTDNRKLFEYSIINLNKNNMIFEYITLDLHEDIKSGKIIEEENIMTEYEEKYKDKGPIYKTIVNFRRN